MTTHQRGLLFIGHGTRDPAGLDEFAALAGLVARLLPHFKLQTAFLELATPDIPTAIERLVEEGTREIRVVPVLLFAAGHAKRDIPLAIENAASRFPNVKFVCSQPLESHPRLLELSERRFCAATDVAGWKANDVSLLLVGRGSLDEAATAAMHRYARLLAGRIGVRNHRVAFMAMASPLLREVLYEIAPKSQDPIIVQPHLLFRGDLLRELEEQVAIVSRTEKHGSLKVAGHLGPDVLLAEALAGFIV